MKPIIPFAVFDKIELRAGTILEAAVVESSSKLVRLLVNLGSEKRQIIAGIRKAYEPEKLIGAQVVIVANLEPRTLAGLESQGMILAAPDEIGLPVVLRPDKAVLNGSEIN